MLVAAALSLIGTAWSDTFRAVETVRLRLLVEAVAGTHPENDAPSIYEVYDTTSI